MAMRRLAPLAVLVGLVSSASARPLPFEERVRAQEAIERVYHRHTIGETRPFEAVMPRARLEEKVRRSLLRTAGRVTAGDLASELARIRRATRMPARLEEILDALDRDAFLVQECLVRGVLAERLPDGPAGTDPGEVPAVADPAAGIPEGPDAPPDDTWDNGVLDDALLPREGPTAVWTGSLLLVWGGTSVADAPGYRYDPVLDTWTRMFVVGAPPSREGHTAVWTGNRMIVWGGDGNLSDGGVYDPVADSWTATSPVGAPPGRSDHTAVWTGSAMIVWGGLPLTATGGRYDPTTDSWTPTSTAGVSARYQHTAVWTGSRMVVWGGFDAGAPKSDGFRYDPAADAWTPVSSSGAPSARGRHVAVWTGARMVVWGGWDGTSNLANGGRYDPAGDAWTPVSATGAPGPRQEHRAVWTGTEMIVWGGVNGMAKLGDGARYDPAADSWIPVSAVGAPLARDRHAAAWTGSTLVVWSGATLGLSLLTDTGGRYDPATDTWAPTATPGGPRPRSEPASAWTGTHLLVWGGRARTDAEEVLGDGARYDPALDAWSEMSEAGAPSPRRSPTGVWTGSRLLVWGGQTMGSTAFGDGALYDPVLDAWFPVTASGAPAPRWGATGVWTGNAVVVWGGRDAAGAMDTGSRYDPAIDAWSAVTTAGAPSDRSLHTAVWTGSRMVVWGGMGSLGNLGTGGRYDPVADTWLPTSLLLFGRRQHSAVWTGTEMIVWGGITSDSILVGDGARYDPSADAWSGMASSGSPDVRGGHSAVWTGGRMVIFSGVRQPGDGGRYDPGHDAWEPLSTLGAPPGRTGHAAVWTGESMIVWGGREDRSGGRSGVATDSDSDGALDQHDCAPWDAGAIEVPATVTDLEFTDAVTLAWTSTGAPHDVARGVLTELPVGGGASETCVAAGLPGSTLVDPAIPAAGFWYLVRGRNACGGAYGADGEGIPRSTAACP